MMVGGNQPVLQERWMAAWENRKMESKEHEAWKQNRKGKELQSPDLSYRKVENKPDSINIHREKLYYCLATKTETEEGKAVRRQLSVARPVDVTGNRGHTDHQMRVKKRKKKKQMYKNKLSETT